MPRNTPSPSPSQANGAPPQNGIPMVNGLPSGGQQTDMNYLWSVVQQLSALLEENKAQTHSVLSGVQALQQRVAEEGSTAPPGAREVNGEINGTSCPPLPQNIKPPFNRIENPDAPHSRLSRRRNHNTADPIVQRGNNNLLPPNIKFPTHLPHHRLRKRAHPAPR